MADGSPPVNQDRAKKPKPAQPHGKGTASKWLEKIQKSLDREEKPWRIQARRVVQRYRDERQKGDLVDMTRINILWANTEILKSALLPRIPKPDVRRRFPDGKSGNSASRVAAEVIERGVTFVIDTEDTDSVLISAVEDQLLPGRGTVWVTYDPEIEEPEEDDEAVADSDDGGKETTQTASDANQPSLPGTAASNGLEGEPGTASPGSPDVVATPSGGRIIAQRVRFEYVYWEDYTEGQARTDPEVPWKARRHAVPKEEFERKFPNAQKTKLKSTSTYKLTDASDRTGMFNDDDFIEVWEIWARGPRQRIWVGKGYADILEPENDDPYELANFYPCPRPLRGVTTTDRQIPVPEFLQYEDQCAELDRVTTRLHSLTEQLKFHGVYDSSIPDGQAPGSSILATVTKQPDGVFLGHPNFQMIAQRGGIEAVFQALPLDQLIKVIAELQKRRQLLIEEIYQVTGISDIMRGSTDPNETKGAQTLKAQFGSVRMQARQSEIQRFIRDLFRIAGELIAEHYTVDSLREITGFDLPTDAEKAALQAQVDQMNAGAMLPAPPDPAMDPGAGASPPPEAPSGTGGAPLGALPPPPDGGAPAPGVGGAAPLPPPGAPPPPPDMGMGAPPIDASAAGSPPPGMEMGGPPGDEQAAMQPPSGAPPAEAPEPEVPQEIRQRLASPTWEEVMAILRSDKLRGYRVDIETDSTMVDDADAEKQRRVEAISGINDLLDRAVNAAMTMPKMMPLYKELTMFGLRTFKPARSLEQAVEDTFDELQKNPPEPPPDPAAPVPPPPDPANQMKAQAAADEVARKSAKDQADNAIEQQRVTADTEMARAELDKVRAETEKILTDAQTALQALQTGGPSADVARKDALAKADIAVEQEKITASQARTLAEVEGQRHKQGLDAQAAQTDQHVKLHQAAADTQQAAAAHQLRAQEGAQKQQLNAAEGQARIRTAFMKASRPSPAPPNGGGGGGDLTSALGG
jgi:hypothetical protein